MKNSGKKIRNRLSDICPVCGSHKISKLYPSDIDISKLSFTYVKTPYSSKTFRSVRCLYCTHVFCSPLPKNIYKNYLDVVDKEYLNYVESIKISAGIIIPQLQKYVSKGILLDVGCATGEFLDVAREFGYSVEGLELSKWSSEIARSKGIVIYRQRLKALAEKFPKKYDIITLFGVIEHFENPLEEMSYIQKLLKSNGVLLIWTGNIDSLPSKILGKSWWYWQGQHIQYFSEQSLNLLAEKSGIKHVATGIYPFVAMKDLLENSFSRYKFRKFIMIFAVLFFLIKPTWTFYIPGEMLWFGQKMHKT